MIEKGKYIPNIPILDKGGYMADIHAFTTLESLILRFSEIQDKIKNNDLSVLDIGTGKGECLKSFRKLGLNKVVGIDYNKISGQKEVGGVLHADAHHLPFLDQSFDIVTDVGLFEPLFYKNNLLVILKEIHRVLKPGGFLHSTDLEDFDLPKEMGSLFEEIDFPGTWRKK